MLRFRVRYRLGVPGMMVVFTRLVHWFAMFIRTRVWVLTVLGFGVWLVLRVPSMMVMFAILVRRLVFI